MRIDVKKFIFIGHEKDKAQFFKKAQALGVIEFQEKEKEVNPDIQLYVEALRILRQFPRLNQEEGNPKSVAEEVLHLKKKRDQVEEAIRISKLEMARISVFGQFSLDDIAYLRKHLAVQFFCSKKKVPNLIHIASLPGLEYYLSLNKEPVSNPDMIEMKFERSLNEEKDHLIHLQTEWEAIEHQLKEKAKYHHLLHQALTDAWNHTHLKNAENGAVKPLQSLFTATGWIPKDKLSYLLELTNKTSVFAEEIAIEPEDRVPTYLENEKIGKMGEDLIGIYDTPSNQDKDPSLWVLSAFILFFAMIIGDGGYGSIYLGLTLYLRYKYPDLKGAKKRVLNLATILSVACMVWGLLTTSFFGIQVSSDNPIRELSLTHALALKKQAYFGGGKLVELQDQVLLEIALFIGVIHLIMGLIRYIKRNPGNVGWILFLIGSSLYFPLYLQTPSFLNYLVGIPLQEGGEVGLQLMGIGLVLAVGIAIFRVGFAGLAEIMTLIQVFADALSYLRLYALGLSGSILSSTINSMSSHLPFLVALLLIVCGHLINMALGLMGGVIHGLRLNFIEWYHYSFEGGGRKFKPLNIKEN